MCYASGSTVSDLNGKEECSFAFPTDLFEPLLSFPLIFKECRFIALHAPRLLLANVSSRYLPAAFSPFVPIVIRYYAFYLTRVAFAEHGTSLHLTRCVVTTGDAPC